MAAKRKSSPSRRQHASAPATPPEKSLSRPWDARIAARPAHPPDGVDEYLRDAGLAGGVLPWPEFWKRIDTRHEKAGRRLRRCLEARSLGDMDQDVYRLKNATLDLSLDASRQYFVPVLRTLLQRLGTWQGAPSRVLDVGCENGVVACFMARCWPDAEVVGVDQSPEAIAAADELARRLRLNNVRFVAGDAWQLGASWRDDGFDLVVAACLVAGALQFEPEPGFMDDAGVAGHAKALIRQATGLASLLRADDHARLVSLDRWPFAWSLAGWVAALESAGLVVRWGESSHAVARTQPPSEASDEAEERLPLVVAERRHASSPSIPPFDQALTLFVPGTRHEPYDVRTLGMDTRSLLPFEEAAPGAFRDDEASLVFRAIGPKTRVGAWLIRHGGLYEIVTEQREVWTTPTLALDWRALGHGARLLRVLPLSCADELVRDAQRLAEEITARP